MASQLGGVMLLAAIRKTSLTSTIFYILVRMIKSDLQ